MRTRHPLLSLVLAGLPVACFGANYIGTYTGRPGEPNGSAGIYRFDWDARQGILRDLRPAIAAVNPSFLALSRDRHYLFAVAEGTESRVTAYAVQADGGLTEINSVAVQGKGACHVAVDATGRWLFVSNYGSGSLSVIPVTDHGRLGEASQVIDHGEGASQPAHAHQAVLSPDGRFVLSVDLGRDRVYVYPWDSGSGRLAVEHASHFDAPSGSGPRHLAFSTDGLRVYLLTELSAELLTLDWLARDGTLRQRAITSVLPPAYAGTKSGAEIALDPAGHWLFASSRGSDDIAVFALPPDGTPRLIGHHAAGGRKPRFIGLDPAGRFLLSAAQESGVITVLRVERSGELVQQQQYPLPSPVDIAWQ